MALEVGIFLFGHQCDDEKLGNYGKVIHAIGEQHAPYTVFLTGMTLERIQQAHPLLVGAIGKYFPENAGGLNPHDPEIGVSAYHHFPLVPMGLELEHWGKYLKLSEEQIRWTKERLWYDFGKNSRGIFPPEAVFAPAAASTIRRNWLSYSILDGAHLNRHEKGQVFQQDGLKLVARNNEIPISNPRQTRELIMRFCYDNDVSRVVLGRDVDDFCNYGMNVNDGVRLLCRVADELYRDHEIEFKNIASIADDAVQPRSISDVYAEKGILDPWHYTSSWIDADGRLAWLVGESRRKNDVVNEIIRRLSERDDLRHDFYRAAGMEFRHPGWTSIPWFNDTFYRTMGYVMARLGMEAAA